MKKTTIIILVIVVAIVGALLGYFIPVISNNSQQGKKYVLQYTDASGIRELEVEHGQLYALESIPQKTGYNFNGLFDAEVGGTQYVSDKGVSLFPFTDKKNLVLYPQYTIKEYTFILDYQGATVTGERQFTSKYNSQISNLPINLYVEHKEFVGWFTKNNCQGVQVADIYGLLPIASIVNETNFILDDADYIYLYAGFKTETIKVTLNFGEGIESEEVDVEYNFPTSQIVTNTKNSSGYAVLSWSKTAGGVIFSGNIKEETTLYAVEWAPIIEFDTNGGGSCAPIIAREGANIVLPQITKENYKFLGWRASSSAIVNEILMPAQSTTFTAVWQACLIFDENGGSEINDISQAEGTSVSMPEPSRNGYIFAGWYYDGEKYTSNIMPAVSVKLKAGWYEVKKITKTILTYDNPISGYNQLNPSLEWAKELDISDIVKGDYSGKTVQVKGFVRTAHEKGSLSSPAGTGIAFYDNTELSSAYLLSYHKFENKSTEYIQFTFETTWTLDADLIYICFYCSSSSYSYQAYFKDFYLEISYPDTSIIH